LQVVLLQQIQVLAMALMQQLEVDTKVDEAQAETQQMELNRVAVVAVVTSVVVVDVVRLQVGRYKMVAVAVALVISMPLK
jgi:hypothetical protein